MRRRGSREKADPESLAFLLFLVFMAVYYLWRLFALTPWYDELYTYYYFISRGPVYAAIHWPLPNNHIGYSVLSACLNPFGNAAVALRGVSCASSLGSLVFLFLIGRKCLGRGMALLPVYFYAGMKIVNQLAVQGRGYSLVTFCYLAALYGMLHIAVTPGRRRDYLLLGAGMVFALYAIPSSVYVAALLCLTGGIALILQGKYDRLVRSILTVVVSAVCTVGLYGIVWLAVGSNLLVKTEGSAWYGMGHAAMILRAPFAALDAGIRYMLATPYIQGVGRKGYLGKLAVWLRNLLQEYYGGGALLLAVLLILCALAALWGIGRKVRQGTYRQEQAGLTYEGFLELHLAVSILCIPLMLTVQGALPYYRVFSFAGVIAAFAAAWLIKKLLRWIRCRTDRPGGSAGGAGRSLPGVVNGAVNAAGLVLCLAALFSPSYTAQYSDREAAIEDAYEQVDWTAVDRVAVTDCDQEYLLLFLYGIGEDKITQSPEEADAVLADKYLLLGAEAAGSDLYQGDDWKLYLSGEEFARFLERADLTEQYENDRFILFK